MIKKSKDKKAAAVTAEMYDIIKRPVVTEKSTMASEHGKVVFLVHPDASKPQIKRAVEALFGVEVARVNTANQSGKRKRFRGIKGKRPDTKKAVVTMKEGQTIDIMAGVK